MRKIFGFYILSKKEFDVIVKDVTKEVVDIDRQFNEKSTCSAIRPVINDLEKLRQNTWDQDKITNIQEWLKNNFEVKE